MPDEPTTNGEVKPMKETILPPAPAEALIKLERLEPETINHIIGLLEKDVLPNLQADVSSYAKGRMRVWLPYEAPLDSPQSFDRPFIPGLLHGELWQFIVDLCAKHGFTAKVALASKGGSIKPHRDTTYAAEWSFGINLGECIWNIASSRDLPKPDYSMQLKGGEVFKFNCKHVHSVVNAVPDRWAINVWAIADTNAAHKVNINARLQTMLDENPQVAEFINKHKPTINGEVKPMKEETAQEKLKRLTQEYEQKQKEGVIAFMNDSFHTITNDPTDKESLAYSTVQKTGKPFKMGTTVRIGKDGEYKHNLWLMPINNSPTWQYGLLENKLNARGIKFKLQMITVYDLKTWISKDNGDLETLIEQSNFAWSNATHAFFLKTRNDNNWSLEELGMQVKDFKKTSKRLQEISRYSQVYRSRPINRITTNVFTNKWLEDYYSRFGLEYNPTNEVIFDGPAFMRKSAFIKECLNIKDPETKRKIIGSVHNDCRTWLFRMIMPNFMLKGLLHIVEDDDIESDIQYHESMQKKELSTTNGNYTFVAWPMPTVYEVTIDDQSMINNPWLYTPEQTKAMCDNLLSDFKKEVEEGKMPEWMTVSADEQEDGGIVNEDNELQEWQANYVKWQKAGFSLHDSSNFIHMAYGQLANRMSASLKRGTIWLPMFNAFMAPVVTHEALQIMGGQMLPESKSNVVWYDKRFGAIIPGNRFADTAELHDTWDQDGDMARFIRIKLWCSNPVAHSTAIDGWVIQDDIELPQAAEEAIDMVVIIRSPNGPGGYSIEPYDADTMPFMRVNEDMVQVIDLANATLPMSTLLEDVNIDTELNDILDNTEYSKTDMTRDNAGEMIEAQMSNPGFGSFSNFMMVYSNVYGPSYPSYMPASGNDIIDASSQTANVDAFKFINTQVAQLWNSMVEDIVENNLKVDNYVQNRIKMSILVSGKLEGNFYDGPLTELANNYSRALKDVREETKNTMYLRTRSELIPALQLLIPTLSEQTQAICEDFNSKYLRKLRAFDNRKRERRNEETQNSSRYFKAWNSVFISQDLESVVKEMVDEIETSKFPTKMAVAIYRWMTDPEMSYEKVFHEGRNEYVKANAHLRYGLIDRVMFQAGKRGQRSMMDLLIQGLKDLGL